MGNFFHFQYKLFFSKNNYFNDEKTTKLYKKRIELNIYKKNQLKLVSIQDYAVETKFNIDKFDYFDDEFNFLVSRNKWMIINEEDDEFEEDDFDFSQDYAFFSEPNEDFQDEIFSRETLKKKK